MVEIFLFCMLSELMNLFAKGILRVIAALKWKSFTLVAEGDEDNEDDVQNIAKKLTQSSIEKGLCVLVHDTDEEDFTSHIVHIGKPADNFFRGPPSNSTIIVASEGNLRRYLNRVNSSNTILLVEDARYVHARIKSCFNKGFFYS